MIRFYEFINESKNTHLEHIEDSLINFGFEGLVSSVSFLNAINKMLKGSSSSRINITTKWDGAPAIVCGINPENNRFFVGTKSVFNKREPKINYTNNDIDLNHPNPDLNEKLKIALKELSSVGIKGILQGDFLFTRKDLTTISHDNEKLIGFQPNTILYTVDQNSSLGKRILSSKMGIVFHTSYSGSSLATAKASFSVNINSLKKSRNVWITDASFSDQSGNVKFTSDESAQMNQLIKEIIKSGRSINKNLLNEISSNNEIRMLFKRFINHNVRTNTQISNVSKFTTELLKFISDHFENQKLNLKTERGRESKDQKHREIQSYILSNKSEIEKIFLTMNLIVSAKMMIIRKLNSIESLGTFIVTNKGLQATTPEGYVAVDHHSGNAMKLVDRMEFSYNNFNIVKNWSQ